jgi:hypothetical protein
MSKVAVVLDDVTKGTSMAPAFGFERIVLVDPSGETNAATRVGSGRSRGHCVSRVSVRTPQIARQRGAVSRRPAMEAAQ